jgi:hypothetical protein
MSDGVFETVWSDTQSIAPVAPDTWNVLADLGGESVRDNWVPPRFESTETLVVDRPWLGEHLLALNERAVEALGSYVEACGELLKLEHDDGPLWLLNPRFVLDALGPRSEVTTFKSSGNIKSVIYPDFRSEVIEGVDLFKLAGPRSSTLYYSQRVVMAIEEAGLTGPRFRRITTP